MAKLAVVIFAVLVIPCLRCLAEDTNTLVDQKDDAEDTRLEDEIGRSASALGQGKAVGGRMQPHYMLRGLIECYACIDCPKVLSNTTTKGCPGSNDPSKDNKCVVYSEKYQQMKKPWYIRGCATERGSCADIKKAHEHHENIVTLLSCVECDGDKCNVNGVARSIPDLMTSFVMLVVTPIFGKFTLS